MRKLLAAAVQDVLRVGREEAFFLLSPAMRTKRVRQTLGEGYPQELREYLSTCEVPTFVSDIRELLPYLTRSHGVMGRLAEREESLRDLIDTVELPQARGVRSTREEALQVEGVELSKEFLSDVRRALFDIVATEGLKTARTANALVTAWTDVCAQDVRSLLEAEQPPEPVSALHAAIAQIFVERRTESALRALQQFVAQERHVPAPVIQTPVPLPEEERNALRSTLAKEYPGAVVIFEVERSLAGGVRFFVNGTMSDMSWMTGATHTLQRIRAVSGA